MGIKQPANSAVQTRTGQITDAIMGLMTLSFRGERPGRQVLRGVLALRRRLTGREARQGQNRLSPQGTLFVRKLKDEAPLKRARIHPLGGVKRTLSQVPHPCHIRSMKTVTLGQARTKLQALLRLVATGEEVGIVENRRLVARLVPPPPDTVEWGETFAKLEAIWGKEPLPGVPGSEIVSQGRR